jgi:hypothetical protein
MTRLIRIRPQGQWPAQIILSRAGTTAHAPGSRKVDCRAFAPRAERHVQRTFRPYALPMRDKRLEPTADRLPPPAGVHRARMLAGRT